MKYNITREDVLPLFLGAAKTTVVLLPVIIVLFGLHYLGRIAFYVGIGLSIPLTLASNHLVTYLIGRIILNNDERSHNQAL